MIALLVIRKPPFRFAMFLLLCIQRAERDQRRRAVIE
jgi:hypothetical protein